MFLCSEPVLLLTNTFEEQCSRSARGGIKDSVSPAKYGSAQRLENAVLVCPVLFPFPLLALHRGQEEECWKIESRKHGESVFTDCS